VKAGPTLPDLPAGVYLHYKGHQYLVLGYAGDAGDEERTVVVYVGLQMDGNPSPVRMRIREVGEFFTRVDPATGQTRYDDDPSAVPRFRYLGPSAVDQSRISGSR
jgi:hypothetical protein